MEEWDNLSKEEQEKKIQEEANGEEIVISDLVYIQDELDMLLTGNAVRVDKNLHKLLSGSNPYWRINKNDLFHLFHTQEKQLEANGLKLLYFRPSEYYQQLNYLSDIEANY